MQAKYKGGSVNCMSCHDNGQESVYELEVVNETMVEGLKFLELGPIMTCPECGNTDNSQWAYFARQNEIEVLYV